MPPFNPRNLAALQAQDRAAFAARQPRGRAGVGAASLPPGGQAKPPADINQAIGAVRAQLGGGMPTAAIPGLSKPLPGVPGGGGMQPITGGGLQAPPGQRMAVGRPAAPPGMQPKATAAPGTDQGRTSMGGGRFMDPSRPGAPASVGPASTGGPRPLNLDARINPATGAAEGRNPATNEFDPPGGGLYTTDQGLGSASFGPPQGGISVAPAGSPQPIATAPEPGGAAGLANAPGRYMEMAQRIGPEAAMARWQAFQAGQLPGQQAPQMPDELQATFMPQGTPIASLGGRFAGGMGVEGPQAEIAQRLQAMTGGGLQGGPTQIQGGIPGTSPMGSAVAWGGDDTGIQSMNPQQREQLIRMMQDLQQRSGNAPGAGMANVQARRLAADGRLQGLMRRFGGQFQQA